MRTLPLASLAALAFCAACGQKGPLVLPQKSVATPVVIRAPAAEAPAAATPAPAAPSPEQAPPAERKRDETEPPPPQH